MPSPLRASTPSGSWVSGNGALRGLASPCETRGSSRISGGPSPTLRRRTMSALPTACAATSSTNTSAGRRDSPRRGASSHQRGLRLILDFVPNHVAPDHPWVSDHPEYFIQGSAEDARSDPASFIEFGGKVFACGRDPYFPAWPDVLQLNAFHPGLRQAVIETISEIAEQCDGIRCDMAMLMLNDIFERTWGGRADPNPTTTTGRR